MATSTSSCILNDMKHVCERAGFKDLHLSVDPKFQLPDAHTSDGRHITGLTAIGRHLSDQDTFHGRLSRAEKAAQLQWMEYRTKRIDQCGHNKRDRKQLLQDLNGHLKRRSYLTGANVNVVDYVVYLGLAPILTETSLLEREAYTHIGRWFQLVHENWSAVNGNTRRPLETERPRIIFSKTPL